mgnify:CR=1 FL=1
MRFVYQLGKEYATSLRCAYNTILPYTVLNSLNNSHEYIYIGNVCSFNIYFCYF